MQIHTVQQGDSLYSIAAMYRTSPDTLARDNQLGNPNRLTIGQALVIAGAGSSYTVQSGDSLFSIGEALGVPFETMLRNNPNLGVLHPGQTISVPTGVAPQKTIFVNGYCYPHIAADVLRATAPYISAASVFSYEARQDGSLRPIPDDRVLALLRELSIQPIMVLSNIDESGSFSSELASAILRDMGAQSRLIDNIQRVIQDKGYLGLDVDLEYVYGTDREYYNAFLERLSAMLHPLGLPLSTAVPAKTRVDQPGILYEGVDYAAHGRIADRVMLMTYDWGYVYGPPMAVSPYHLVEEVVRFAVGEIPPDKVLLGMPNYAYDWPIPYATGNAASLVRNPQAVDIAAEHWAEILFDPTSRAPMFLYRANNGQRREVWYDDARSFQARLSLIERYGLGGMGYWNINTFFSQGWLVLADQYRVLKFNGS